MCSSTYQKSSSHPLISLPLFWYLISSSSYLAQVSLIFLMKSSRISSPLPQLRISLTSLSCLSRSTCQRWFKVRSLKQILILSFVRRSFQCLGFIASDLSSLRIMLTFLYFPMRALYSSYTWYCLSLLGKSFIFSRAWSRASFTFLWTNAEKGVSLICSTIYQTLFTSLQMLLRPIRSSSKSSSLLGFPSSMSRSSLALQILTHSSFVFVIF